MALIAITCRCGHVGFTASRKLPRTVTCSRCGNVQHVEQSDVPSLTAKAKAMASAWRDYDVWDAAARRRHRLNHHKKRAATARAKFAATFGRH